MPKDFLLVSDADSLKDFQTQLKTQAASFAKPNTKSASAFSLPATNQRIQQPIETALAARSGHGQDRC